MLNYAGDKLYIEQYKKHSLKFNSYLLSDSHGLPLGDSLEKYGIYNFSAGSDSYFDMKRKLNYLIRHTKVDTVYITVDEHTLSPYREVSNNLDRSVYYTGKADYRNVFEYAKKKVLLHISFFQPKKRTVLKHYIFSLFKKIYSSSSEDIKEKEMWSHLSEEQRLLSSENRFKSQFSKSTTSEKLKLELEKIIGICLEKNIVLIGVKFPLTPEYIKTVNGRTYGASKLFEEKRLQILDYKTVFINQEEYFRDQDHLNDDGGESLRLLIGRDIK